MLVSSYADGHFSVEEKSFVSQVCAYLGVSVAEFEALHIQVKQQAHFRQGYQSSSDGASSKDLLKSAYEVLGVTEDMTDADIKKAYRRLMSKNHPDKLSSQGLPKEMIELAKEKTQEIQSAYELIKKARK
ncbi:DnaJ domain-containing protein [Marinomonas sp. GJ51-6]|uniref:DnaJ domain-containing protein n=1 Tax=Marinomonas sp. GJ51-6 TaxID=2992802 RepID=UPI002934EF6E|nr:DnaJ domain-containing protein [Marinomonas sp. GJ51-6]WOD06384.1 DnaJ domain-containing protein [Marinomonas sp. GJ51-6]